MSRLVDALPKYRLHKASGQAVVTLSGRDHYLGLHGTKASKAQYDRLISEYLSSGRSLTFGTPKHDLSVMELAAAYLNHAKSYYGTGPNSEYHRFRSTVRPLRKLYGRAPAAEFGPLQLKALRQSFIAEELSRNYINACCRRVIRIFRWAVAEGMISPTVPQALAMVPGLRAGKSDARETARVLPVDDAVVELTLPRLPDVIADMVRVQRLTGMRPAEVCILRPCDLDRSSDVWLYRPERHKTQHHGKERIIHLGPKAQAVLLRYLARDAKAYCFQPCDSEAKRRAAATEARKTPLSCGNRPGTHRRRRPKRQPGNQYDTNGYRRAIARACEKAFPHPTLTFRPSKELTIVEKAELFRWRRDHCWAPNQLRHAAATEVRSQFGLEAAQVSLGHSQASITEIYAERNLKLGVEVARAIG